MFRLHKMVKTGHEEGMWVLINKVLDRIESRIALWQIISASGILGGGIATAVLSSTVVWINQFGWFGWWICFLSGCVLAAATLSLFALFKKRRAEARAIQKWSKDVSSINPLDKEYHNQRIYLPDLVNPVTKMITGKRFIDCELIGPCTILLGINRITDCGFWETNLIPIKNDNILSRVPTLHGCDLIGCQLMEINLLFPIKLVPVLEGGFYNESIHYITLTGIPEIDSRSHQGNAPEKSSKPLA